MTDTSPRPLRRVLVVVLGVIALGAVGRFAFGVDAPGDVLLLPQVGAVRAAQLGDGTPLFLAHPREEDVVIIEALAPGDLGPVGALVGWCPAVQQYLAPHHGLRWDAVGEALPVLLPGRLPEASSAGAAIDLVRRSGQRVDGRGEAEDPVLVEGRVVPGTPAPPLLLEGARTFSPPSTCRVRPAALPVDDEVAISVGHAPHVLDHAFQAQLLRLPHERWQVTDGTLLVDPDGSTTWCRVLPQGMPPTCGDPAPVPLDLDIDPEDTGGAWAVIGDPLAAEVVEGRVVGVAVMPRSTWRGSSLRGAVRYEADRAAIDRERGRVLLHPTDPAAAPSCLSPPPRRPGRQLDPGLEQAVDADTTFSLGGRPAAVGADGVQELDSVAEALDGTASVEVLLDRATCRALAIEVDDR